MEMRVETSPAYGEDGSGTEKNLGQVHLPFPPKGRCHKGSRDFGHDDPSVMHFSIITDPTIYSPNLIRSSTIYFIIPLSYVGYPFFGILYLFYWFTFFFPGYNVIVQ